MNRATFGFSHSGNLSKYLPQKIPFIFLKIISGGFLVSPPLLLNIAFNLIFYTRHFLPLQLIHFKL
ncbi:Uncharacterised protein [Legionella wadsworthii]|uniref:Uncharacterized protein n=1 Tax=Legionella wadsworthii TaxID=28088 RepID=A0A378LV75_9GAMM|nr:Uncharacterised protein [Legionella wadsworthii]